MSFILGLRWYKIISFSGWKSSNLCCNMSTLFWLVRLWRTSGWWRGIPSTVLSAINIKSLFNFSSFSYLLQSYILVKIFWANKLWCVILITHPAVQYRNCLKSASHFPAASNRSLALYIFFAIVFRKFLKYRLNFHIWFLSSIEFVLFKMLCSVEGFVHSCILCNWSNLLNLLLDWTVNWLDWISINSTHGWAD